MRIVIATSLGTLAVVACTPTPARDDADTSDTSSETETGDPPHACEILRRHLDLVFE
ncbi:hypothetical protein [Enhygromyxa salina]|uniref:Lipoprotein n=1 Tax=Enhygromyxa salina TaxID=215803 RepID=A0A2S9YWD9_9BACT|nr:hypothetical protein [Enhygromyxa salina]PRQ09421.1 hypothetical protein ENSA7_08270 [Enhygromyxa salina]